MRCVDERPVPARAGRRGFPPVSRAGAVSAGEFASRGGKGAGGAVSSAGRRAATPACVPLPRAPAPGAGRAAAPGKARAKSQRCATGGGTGRDQGNLRVGRRLLPAGDGPPPRPGSAERVRGFRAGGRAPACRPRPPPAARGGCASPQDERADGARRLLPGFAGAAEMRPDRELVELRQGSSMNPFLLARVLLLKTQKKQRRRLLSFFKGCMIFNSTFIR